MGLSDLETIPESGAVFTVGRSRFADNIASHFFIRKDPVISITCGDEHSAVICQSGRLFVFGSNDWGQLGLGHRNHISKPSCVKVLKPEKVTHVACGRAHTLICTGEQKIFACGTDQEGQLGRGTSAIGDFSSSPVLVYDSGLAGSKILQLAAGSHHSLALISDGGVFAWGSNLEGQLGLPDVSGLVNKPTKVQIPEPVKQISAGYYHSAFLTESGSVYVCGESESGKLGINVNFSTQVTPKQMQLPSPAVHVACGGHHTVILVENGNVYCTGSNSNGQLGLGTNVTELQTPKLLSRGMLQNDTISRISCGESHTAIVTGSGKLFTCGDGRHGKLGLEENENNVHELTFVQRYKELFVSKVACGGCHTILVGQRRETDNYAERDKETSQTEHVQKRNSLPPLKLPVNILQTEPHEDTIKAQINPENTDLPSTIKTELDNVTNNEENMNSVTDSMNNIEKVESPKESSNGTKQKTSESTGNEMEPERASKEMPEVAEESEESKVQNENHESINENKKVEPKVDEENNIKEETTPEETNTEQNNKENNNEMSENDAADHKEISEKDTAIDNKSNTEKNDIPESMNEKIESKDTNDDKEKTNTEKQMSPSSSTPPPKPPRLKPGSGNSTSGERTSSMEKEEENDKVEDDERKEDTTEKEAETKEDNEVKKQETSSMKSSTKKQESSSMKSSAKSKSSKSTRSIVDTEDAIEIDKQDDKEKTVEAERMNNDIAQDDADVVQSPAPRTGGRMSKIFKAKKPQGVENGTKSTGAVNHKPKSKTCSIL
ncbi:uncharacterized protein LOC117609034 [Osmia lignaria lignaria]|uniref:uncharacterized protein LOC117609034 n=1 Tax=Osmia lignaria lignaria TaxID=1437193 RepID=UPI00402B2326